MNDELCAEILQAIRDNGGEQTFVMARTATAIWRCLIEMVAEGILAIVDDSNGSTRTFRIQPQKVKL